ncbi:hypothetical protein [Candidatus Albibeggiatoa sp. nov. BB20]|uniref:hypothetical protein n=1 Tax=Candidatus Albibeggiatoa sp. nov. BB20 TaxID=3162723 RepID=UPI0033658CCF
MGYIDGQWTDVHGAGSQRSDPKAGDPTEYPTGFGSQGDAIRIYNYVRLVRGGISNTVYTGGEVPVVSNDTSLFEEPTTDAPPTDNSQETLQTSPEEATAACASLSVGDSCTVQTPENELAGVCQSVVDNSLACVPVDINCFEGRGLPCRTDSSKRATNPKLPAPFKKARDKPKTS